MDSKTLIIGIGNPLVGDEGVGVRVAERLMTEWRFPDGVEVMDAGTMGMGMLGLFSDFGRLIIIDAVDGTGRPAGSVLRMDPDELASTQVLHSLHDVKLADVLLAAELTGATPDVAFLGIQIAAMDPLVTEVTPPVEAAIPVAVDEVLALLDSLGIEAEPARVDRDDAHVLRALRTGEPMRRDAPEA